MRSASSVSGEAEEVLRSRLMSGEYLPGSRMPTERELCVELGISRTALRPALRALETQGLLVSRGSSGRFVSEQGAIDASGAALRWMLHHRQDLEALNEVRQLLEPRAVALIPAADRALVSLRADEILRKQARAVIGRDAKLASEYDADFHTLLTSFAPNAPLRELCSQLVAMGRLPGSQIYGLPGRAESALRDHEGIVGALRRGDAEKAAELVRLHHERFAPAPND